MTDNTKQRDFTLWNLILFVFTLCLSVIMADIWFPDTVPFLLVVLSSSYLVTTSFTGIFIFLMSYIVKYGKP